MKLHSGNKEHKCDICHKGFTRNYTLKQHKKKHKLNCEVCRLEFPSQEAKDHHFSRNICGQPRGEQLT